MNQYARNTLDNTDHMSEAGRPPSPPSSPLLGQDLMSRQSDMSMTMSAITESSLFKDADKTRTVRPVMESRLQWERSLEKAKERDREILNAENRAIKNRHRASIARRQQRAYEREALEARVRGAPAPSVHWT